MYLTAIGDLMYVCLSLL